ncbi:siderophore-interacting protein [Leucobacter sp. USHLN153]|uniref:siderophore-interacting protein n=1 Tax=Leucobacter sp. USHLN153 TaxID=3081268 RepID=UPI003018F2CA
MSLRNIVTHPLVLRRLEVLEVSDLTPRMRRVTFGGDELGPFERAGMSFGAFHSPGFDDHVKAIFAASSELQRVLPIQLEHGIEWTESPARITRDYTPRMVDGAAGTFALDFVMHGHGPASDWARRAVVGEPLWVVGPKSSLVLPEGLDSVVLAGDETALPAIGRFLEERPVSAAASIVITTSSPEARQKLALSDGDRIEWVIADPADPEPLLAAVRRAVPGVGSWFLWAAGESRALLPLRRAARREWNLPPERTSITGYWHVEKERSGVALPEVPSPAAWFVVRAALATGLLDDVADHAGTTVEECAVRLTISASAIAAMMPMLAHHGLVNEESGALRVGAPAEVLLADEHAREAYVGVEANALLSLTTLPEALSRGTSPWFSAHGETFVSQSAYDAELHEERQDEASVLRFVGRGVFDDAAWVGASRTLLVGPGAEEMRALAAESGVRAELIAAEQCERDAIVGVSGCDVGVLALALRDATDAEASALFGDLRGVVERLIVVEPVRADALGPRAVEEPIRAFALNGAGVRDAARITELAEARGWRWTRSLALGWGIEALVLER